MSLSPPSCCHPVGFQHSLPCPPLTGSAGPAAGGTRSVLGSPLQGKAEGQGWQEGSVALGCPGSASWHALGTTGAQHSSVPPAARHPPRQGHSRGAAPCTCGGWGCEGLCSPSMMPHLVLRPSTRLPFTWCSWSAPTTAKGIFSCQQRLCSPRVLLPWAPQGPCPPSCSPGAGPLRPSIPALTRILSFSALSSGSWSKSCCGYTLMVWVFRSSWICGTQGLSRGCGDVGQPGSPSGTCPHPLLEFCPFLQGERVGFGDHRHHVDDPAEPPHELQVQRAQPDKGHRHSRVSPPLPLGGDPTTTTPGSL